MTSPKNGDVLKIGKRYTIKWDKGAGSRVKIQLVNHDDIYLWDEPKITNSTPNDGKFTWTVPKKCTTCYGNSTDPGMRYRIKISLTRIYYRK